MVGAGAVLRPLLEGAVNVSKLSECKVKWRYHTSRWVEGSIIAIINSLALDAVLLVEWRVDVGDGVILLFHRWLRVEWAVLALVAENVLVFDTMSGGMGLVDFVTLDLASVTAPVGDLARDGVLWRSGQVVEALHADEIEADDGVSTDGLDHL